MKFALIYANHEKFNEPWSTPQSIKNELFKRGHSVTVYNLYENDGAFRVDKQPRRYTQQGIVNLLNDNHHIHFDAIILFDYGVFYSPLLTKENFPNSLLIFEFGDCPQALHNHLPKLSNRPDIILCPDHPSTQFLHLKGFKTYFWTHFADVKIFKPLDITPQYDLVSTCGPRGKVTEFLSHNLGNRFFNNRYYYGDEHNAVLNSGLIVLQKSQYGEITRRIMEGAACKRLVLTDRLASETKLSEMFIDGQDMVYYDNPQDAYEKISFYKAHPEERERIAQSGYEKVVKFHSEVARVDELERLINDLQ